MNGKLLEPLEFSIDSDLDGSLANLIIRILPICSYYHQISAFVEEHSAFEYGRAHHALAASIRTLLQEYHILVAQLEHQAHSNPDFSLQKLWFFITPTSQVFENIANLAEMVDEPIEAKQGVEFQLFQEASTLPKTGGVLLSLLAERMTLFSG